MKILKEVVLREIAGENILISLESGSDGRTGFYVLSDVAKRIWELAEQCNSDEAIIEILLQEYDTDRETLTDDMNQFLNGLREMDIIE